MLRLWFAVVINKQGLKSTRDDTHDWHRVLADSLSRLRGRYIRA
jgi:hypothetical protein